MLKVATDCTGIGSPEQALKNLNIAHTVVFACEKDKYARQTYLANNTPHRMFEDMTTRDNAPKELYADIYIAGIPCQPFSLAGKRLGESDVRGTLFYNSYEYLKIHQPKYFIIENVKGLLSDSKGKTFRNWLELLAATINHQEQLYPHPDSLNYHVHYTVLNSMDFGVPQSRERVFIIGIRNDLKNTFKFPFGYLLKFRLKHILEKNVAEKYYLSEKMLNYFNTRKDNFNAGKLNLKYGEDVASTITRSSSSLDISDNLIVVGEVTPNSQMGKVYDPEGIFPTVCAGTHGYCNPYTIEYITKNNFRIRKLTPLECFRLQGFPDSFVKPVSDTQLYRQAGNSITVTVIEEILKNLLQ